MSVHLGAHGGIKITTDERDAGWDVVEQVVRQVDIGDLDLFAAALKDEDPRALDNARLDIGTLHLTLVTLSPDEAETLAHLLLATVRAGRVSA